MFGKFKYFFNLYFLLVALSQLIPSLQIGYLFTYFAPLCFVLFITITKEAWDDFKRLRRDQEANNQKYQKLTKAVEVSVNSCDIRVGDLILVQKNQRVPADMILLQISENSGSCYIRTDQLDGETDWKLRTAVLSTQSLSRAQLHELTGAVYAEAPNKNIHEFNGKFELQEGNDVKSEPLSVENVLWANTVVASGTAVGLVIYTGNETRSVMNTNSPSTKVGLLDLELNFLSKVVSCR